MPRIAGCVHADNIMGTEKSCDNRPFLKLLIIKKLQARGWEDRERGEVVRSAKYFGNHQPSRAQPHHTLETKKWVHIFCLIVLPPCEIKAFYAVRVLYAQCIFGYNTA